MVIVDTKICKNKEEALSKVDFNLVNNSLINAGLEDRNVKEEVLDLIDYVECVNIKTCEANNDIIRIYRDGKKIQIKIVI